MKLLNKNWGFLTIILLSLLPLLSLLHPGLPITHDGQDHVARIANFYQSLSDGNLIPRWAGNLNWGYGHPILMFLYPLPSYSASLFHFLGFSLVDSVKIVFALGFILSGLFMYLWVKEFLGEKSAVAAGLLYLFSPYRFVDLYVRGAIGEHVAFIFPPLICYFLLKINKSPAFKYWYFTGASLSFAGLLLSHNALSLMFLPFIFFYAGYLVWDSKNKKLLAIRYLLTAVLGFALSSFFLIPAFLEGKYTLRDIVTGSEALNRFVKIQDLVFSPWNFAGSGEMSLQIGLLNWLAVLVSPLVIYKFFKADRKKLILYIALLIYFFTSILIMLPISEPFWKLFTVLLKFQFPWRFLSVSIFSAALLGAFAISIIANPNLKKIVLACLILLAVMLTHTYWLPYYYIQRPDSFYKQIYNGTTDTGESAPIWSVRFMEKRASKHAEVIDGSATIKEIFRNSNKHVYEISSDGKSGIVENTLFFPGWKINVDGVEYKEIQFQDSHHRGLITYKLEPGKHNVEIIFGETGLRKISNAVTLLTILILVLIYFFPVRKSNKE